MRSLTRVPRIYGAVGVIVAALAVPVNGAETVQWSGFGFVRGAEEAESGPFFDERLTGQLQLGIEWRPSVYLAGQLHVIARDEADGSRRGSLGLTQAYVDVSIPRGADRFRLLAGAFFLPTTRENVDALWESPFAISSSALNSWLGEEFRPIGVDVSYTARQAFTVGATVFRGNETFGAFPADRGWSIRDYWALLGEHLLTGADRDNGIVERYFTSVSAENDGRLGWSARGRWTSNYATLQLTHIDNRSDGREYGDLVNWDTQFDIAGLDFTRNDWTIAAESGWGTTAVVPFANARFPTDISATYVLVSRRFARGRATLRHDWFRSDDLDGDAFTAAFFWWPRSAWRAGIEVGTSDDETRALIELRYYFSGK